MQFSALAAMIGEGDLSAILGHLPVGVCVLETSSLRIAAANQAFADLAGARGPADLIGAVPSPGDAHPLLAELYHAWTRVAGSHTPSSSEASLPLPGETRLLHVQYIPLTLAGGSRVIATFVSDVTAERRAEEARQEGERQRQALFEGNPNPMWIYDMETFAFLAVNDAAIRHYGYSREEFLSMTIKEIRPPEEVPRLIESVRRLPGGLDLAGVWRHRRKDGSVIYVDIISHTLAYQGRRAEIVLAHDVTERTEAQERLRQATSELNAVFQALPDLYFRLAADGTILDYRAGREADLYVPPSQFMGRRMQEILPGEAARQLDGGIRQVRAERRPVAVEYMLVMDGATRVFEARLVPVLEDQMIAVVRDETERKDAERRLRDSEENYHSIFDTVNDAIFVHDPDTGRILDTNRKMREMYGYTADEARALTVGAISASEPPYTEEDALEWVRRAAKGEPQLFEWLARDRSGRRFWVEVNLKRALLGGRERLLAVVRDISERKRAIAELEEAHQRVLAGEEERKRFYREVIRAVTNDKLHLVEAGDIPAIGAPAFSVPLDQPANYARLRRELREIGERAGMSPEGAGDLLLAAGEAATNAIKHARGGESAVYVAHDRIVVRVSDQGSGIQAGDLPGAILLRGFSTRVSLGMGYTIMLQLADRVWLATGEHGTIVQLEKRIRSEEHPVPALVEAWEKL